MPWTAQYDYDFKTEGLDVSNFLRLPDKPISSFAWRDGDKTFRISGAERYFFAYEAVATMEHSRVVAVLIAGRWKGRWFLWRVPIPFRGPINILKDFQVDERLTKAGKVK